MAGGASPFIKDVVSRVVVRVRVRRLVCPIRRCLHTFREQLPAVLDRCQRRTTRLTRQAKAVVKELAAESGRVCWRYSR